MGYQYSEIKMHEEKQLYICVGSSRYRHKHTHFDPFDEQYSDLDSSAHSLTLVMTLVLLQAAYMGDPQMGFYSEERVLMGENVCQFMTVRMLVSAYF